MPDAAAPSFPPVVLDHVYGEALEEWYQKFVEEQKLLGVERDALDESVWKVYTRASTLDNFFHELEEVFGTPERAKTIGIPILGNDFLKIEDYLGIDIPAYIKVLGGNPSLFVKEIPVAEVVAGVMAGIGVAPSDPVVAKRIEHAVTSFLTGIRDQLETKDVLTRGTKVGGVGLDAATAERIVAALTIQLKELRDAGVIIRTETVKSPEASTFHLVRPGKSSVMQPEDEAEIEQIRRKVIPGDVVGDTIRAAVDRVVQKTGAKFKSDDVSRRFRTAIESRLRDIRDRQETLDLLTRPSVQGGFGIPREQVEKVLKVVEEEVRVLHGQKKVVPPLRVRGGEGELRADRNPPQPSLTLREGVPPPTTPILPSPPPVATLVHPVPPAAAEQQSSRAAEPMPPPPKTQADSPKPQAVPPTPKPAPPPPTKPAPPPPREIATSPRLGVGAPRNDTKLAPAAPPPAPAPPPKPVAEASRPPPDRGDLKVAATPPPPAVRQIPIAPPPPPKPQAPSHKPQATISVTTPPVSVIREHPSAIRTPSVGAAKPRMQDIRPVPPRLVGPIEELQQLALADFRKIAKTPADAAQRIAEKLALLEKDSYTKRAEGVKALRGSALMVAYGEVLTAALMAKRKVEDEVKERVEKDRGALTIEEFHALQSLNTQIRL